MKKSIKKAFTLLEVLISIMILTFIFSLLSKLFSTMILVKSHEQKIKEDLIEFESRLESLFLSQNISSFQMKNSYMNFSQSKEKNFILKVESIDIEELFGENNILNLPEVKDSNGRNYIIVTKLNNNTNELFNNCYTHNSNQLISQTSTNCVNFYTIALIAVGNNGVLDMNDPNDIFSNQVDNLKGDDKVYYFNTYELFADKIENKIIEKLKAINYIEGYKAAINKEFLDLNLTTTDIDLVPLELTFSNAVGGGFVVSNSHSLERKKALVRYNSFLYDFQNTSLEETLDNQLFSINYSYINSLTTKNFNVWNSSLGTGLEFDDIQNYNSTNHNYINGKLVKNNPIIILGDEIFVEILYRLRCYDLKNSGSYNISLTDYSCLEQGGVNFFYIPVSMYNYDSTNKQASFLYKEMKVIN